MSEKQEQTLLKQEKASLQKKLLDAAAAKPQQSGKIVNAYGQEEVGIPKWQQKAAAVREMYASCSTSADVGHQQRILQQLEERKRARAAGGSSDHIRGLASSSSSFMTQIEPDVKRPKLNASSSDSDTSSESGDKERKKGKKSKKGDKKKKHKKDKKKSKKSHKDRS